MQAMMDTKKSYEQLPMKSDSPVFGCVDFLIMIGIVVVGILLLPFWIPVATLMTLILPILVGLHKAKLLVVARQVDAMKASTEWGSIAECCLRRPEGLPPALHYFSVVLVVFLLPFVGLTAVAAANRSAFVIRWADWMHQGQERGLPFRYFTTFAVWSVFFIAALGVNGGVRQAAYDYERVAQGDGDYWWHAQGVFVGKFQIVDELMRKPQHRGLARAAFRYVTPDVFPAGLLIFLSSDQENNDWAQIRRTFHAFFLDSAGAQWKERLAVLRQKIEEDWPKKRAHPCCSCCPGMRRRDAQLLDRPPCPCDLHSEDDMSGLVSKSILWVFFGIWITDEEAEIIKKWRSLAASFVLPRLVHRLAFGYLVGEVQELRLRTAGLVRKYNLEELFEKFNGQLTPEVRRDSTARLADELMFAIGFAGIGGTTSALVSCGYFLEAKLSKDCSSCDLGGRGGSEMAELYKEDPRKFVMETCRISAPVGTFSVETPEPQTLPIVGHCAAGTVISGVINVANMNPDVFKDPFKFDPHRSNLADALTWNGAAFSSKEDLYPRICPGRYLSMEIVTRCVDVALGVPEAGQA